ncbi:hypothetical protein BLNAU_1200 [Blattamonas nauphoetae]|uniref:Peptidase S9 prolyl oligopeptidase catalytic domain-containing protein n=1 Tax=Blattamonas nauphoetae TaxID=2049346 RepID=A0ABQ9YIY8_9EUKA|nr:hypothetical protein BLNAU_1200 [Blattamonas nauphoetae]
MVLVQNPSKAPTLILQDHLDFRVPVSNSVALAQAVLVRGVPNWVVIFETECHWILKKINVIQWSQEKLDGWTNGFRSRTPRQGVSQVACVRQK